MACFFRKAFFTIILLHSFFASVFADIGEKDLLFQEFSVNNGLSQYDVTSIVQDSIGYIWIGTYDGLNRYNGFENKVFRHNNNVANSIPGNRVLCLASGPEGNIWIGTEDGGLGVYNIITEKFMHVVSQHQNLPTSVSAFYFNSKYLIVGTSYGALYSSTIDIKTDSVFLAFNPIPLDPGEFNATNNYVSSLAKIGNMLLVGFLDGELISLKEDDGNYTFYQIINNLNVTDIYVDSKRQVWVGTFTGLKYYKYLEGYETVIDITPEILNSSDKHRVTSISEDINGTIWFTTYLDGLFQLKKAENNEYVLAGFSTQNSKIGVDNLSTTFIDKSNTLWLGSHTDGVRIIDLFQKEFYKVSFYNDVLAEAGNLDQKLLMSSCFIDSFGNLWVGIQEKGLFMYSVQSKIYHFSSADKTRGLNTNTITKIIEDSKGNLWFTGWQGLYMLSYKNNSKAGFRFNQISSGIQNSEQINNDSHFAICEDLDGNIWVGGYSGLYKLVLSGPGECSGIIDYSDFVRKNNLDYWVMSLASDKDQRVILAGTKGGGLFQINYSNNDEEIAVEQFSPNLEGDNYISNSNIWVIKTFDDKAWVGTDQGLNLLVSENGRYTFKELFNTDDGLRSNKIVSIERDFDGNIWLGTGLGLSKYSLSTGSMSNYDYYDGLQSNSFNETSAKDDKGRLFFGGINGLNYFYPDQITDSYSIPSMKITSFYVGNQEVTPGLEINKSVPVTKSIPFVENIYLDYLNNDFSIYFQSFNYSNVDNNIYEYKIDGYDKDWLTAIGNNRVATYSNLPYGEHTFFVRLANNEKLKQSTTQSLTIYISRPPWLTWWAYTIYVLLGVGILFFIIRYFIEHSRHKNEILIEKHKREQVEELNEMKIRFFMNISHELRTPLTLIMEPLQLLKEHTIDNPKVRKYINLAGVNAQKLHHLITQLLEFQQTETGNKKLNPEKADLVGFVQSIYNSFVSLTDKKSIRFNFESNSHALHVCFDKDIIDKILSNLISNAYKFTDYNGVIKLSIDQVELNSENLISISVTDNGIGIPEGQQDKIFERFYQGKGNSGFGIGLAFSKNLAILHHGNLEVISKPGQGAKFILTIPKIDSFKNEEELNPSSRDADTENYWRSIEYDEPERTLLPQIDPSEEQVVLLAEDNTDLREFVSSYLSDSYTVLSAENGEEAFKIATQELPDVVITDIMMPVMDGIELAKKLSEDIHTNHIPVIFLTAKDKDADQLAGFETGAVDYIVKPFNIVHVHKKIDNLLQTLRLQQDRTRSSFLLQSGPDQKKDHENKFISKAVEIVKANLNNSDFDVSMFCVELGVSRMQLHRKLKGTIGQTTTEFVRSVRIKYAAELLSQGQHNVSQAMYESGFDNPSYFTKSFKKIYGVNPSEYSG
jgi:signal transduction histidine kinase/ligand-binding sensor domain-containing protein/DNA-binding response OmpR family regulator